MSPCNPHWITTQDPGHGSPGCYANEQTAPFHLQETHTAQLKPETTIHFKQKHFHEAKALFAIKSRVRGPQARHDGPKPVWPGSGSPIGRVINNLEGLSFLFAPCH